MRRKSTRTDPARQSTCQRCETPFVKRQVTAPGRFCSLACRVAAQSFLDRQPTPCRHCGKEFVPHGRNPGVFCSITCKSEWQKAQKPVDRDWLFEKYVVEGRGIYEIGRVVGRDPKRVWEWLKGYDIPTRPRGHAWGRNRAFAFFLHGDDSPFAGRHHTEETRRRLSEMAKADGRVPFDPAVGPPYRGKRGAETPNWKGGVTPERQGFYSSPEWKASVVAVWRRDGATCRRCARKKADDRSFPFDIHHVVSFAYRPLRADPENLVLLCEPCHYWVHSNANADRVFVKEVPPC